jgi:hypothetical protein
MKAPARLALTGVVVALVAAGTLASDAAVATLVLLVLALLAAGTSVALTRFRARPGPTRPPRWWDAPASPVQPTARRLPPPPPPSAPPPSARIAEPGLPARLNAMRPPPTVELAAVACVAGPLLVLAGAPPWLRFPAVALVLALAPGTALLRLLQPPGRRIDAALAICISLAATVVIAQCMLWAGVWHPQLFMCLLAVSCLAGMAVPQSRSWRIRRWATKRAARPGAAVGAAVGDRAPVYSPLGVLRATRRRRWTRVRRRQQPAGLSALLLSDATADGPERVPADDDAEPVGASVVVRTQGDPATLALALRALLVLKAPDGAGGRVTSEPLEPGRPRRSIER